MPKFTPGPWELGIWNDNGGTPIITPDFGVYGKQGHLIARVFGTWNDGNQTANANLIAAAPELYVVLNELTEELGAAEWGTPEQAQEILSGIIKRHYDSAIAALATAEGRGE